MKYSPRLPRDNVNVSKTHPLTELAWQLCGLVLISALLFFTLGLATDLAVSKTPIQVENWLGKQAMKQFPAKKHVALQIKLEELLKSLPADSALHDYDFRIYVLQTEEVNAIALPGGSIVVYSKLLQQIESENELAMVLFHELGHYAHRDHLRGLGRGFGLTLGSALLFGLDSYATELLSTTLLSFQANYSQKQESAADSFGLDLLVRHYGHAGGATDFFNRLSKNNMGKLPYLLASHPHPQDRIDALEHIIIENGYHTGETTLLPKDLRP